MNLLNASLTVHKGLLDEKIRKEKIISSFLKNESVLTYIENFVSRKETSRTETFRAEQRLEEQGIAQ